jgi:CubicO group peptidase (beta-lactamase class C family)
MSFFRSAVFACVVVFVLASSMASAQVKGGLSPVDARVQRIQDSIMPGTVVTGETLQTRKLSDVMAELHVPGVSIAVIHDGQIEWARGFGVTKAGGPPVTPETLFQAASISKPVTALAVLRLVQSGKLDLDTDVNQYLKSWKVPENEFTAKKNVTLRELLTHTAGTTVHGFPGYAAGAPVPALVQVLNGEKPANTEQIRVETVPGTNWSYSGGGYVIIQQVLEDVTGKPFPKIMQELVLGPIGMTHSTYEQPLPASRLREAAMPYQADGQPVEGGPHTYPEMAPAGLWTTPSDLARYAIEVQKALAGKSNRVISAATARRMLTPVMNHFGLGLGTGGSQGHAYFTHSGANEGFQCNLIAYENGDGAVIMTNSDRGGALGGEIQRTIAYEYKWPDFQPTERTLAKIDSRIFDAYAGAYLVGRRYMTVNREGERFYAHLTGQQPVEIFPQSDHEFFLKTVDAQLSFKAGPDGKATQVTLRQNGNDQAGTRLNDSEAKLVTESQAAAPKKFKDQTQDPRTEAALRQLLDDMRRGEPKYDLIMPSLANLLREDLPDLQGQMKQLGAVKTIAFKGVGPGGSDIYQVKFESGEMECRLMLASDGMIVLLGF